MTAGDFYNLTNFTQASDPAQLTIEVSKLGGSILGYSLMVILGFILFVSMKNYSTKTAFIVMLLVETILSFFLGILQLIPQYIFMAFLLPLAVMVAMSVGTRIE